MSDKAALVIIFNHRYDKNIMVLEKLYQRRFSCIYYLVPFYDGDKPNVIPVYDNSYRYQGYIAQGFRSYFKEGYSHYLFIADDLLLHPDINEDNYTEHFKLGPDASFIPEPFEPHHLHNNQSLRFTAYKTRGQTKFYWWRLIDLIKYKHHVEGLENRTEMPAYDEAKAILKKHGYTVQPLKFRDLYGAVPELIGPRRSFEQFVKYIKWLRHYRTEYRADFPVVASFSDIVIVSKASVRTFAHYCGVFASNGLFVEFAIPTALLLASKNVMTEPKLGKRGSIYWTYTQMEANQYAAAMNGYGNSLSQLLADFPTNKLYIHPIKLSQWKS